MARMAKIAALVTTFLLGVGSAFLTLWFLGWVLRYAVQGDEKLLNLPGVGGGSSAIAVTVLMIVFGGLATLFLVIARQLNRKLESEERAQKAA